VETLVGGGQAVSIPASGLCDEYPARDWVFAAADAGNAGTPPASATLTELGVGGVVVVPGDHICAFHSGAAGRDELLIAYAAAGWHAVGTAERDQGCSHAAVAGEISWVLERYPGVEGLCAYETTINHFAPMYPNILLCLYDLERVTGAVILDVLKAHPRVLIGNTMVENPYCVAHSDVLARTGGPGEPARATTARSGGGRPLHGSYRGG
jgi:hypothetical protein